MVEITSWMYEIIPGFVYLSASFFIFLSCSGIYKINIDKDNIREYLPYIAIVLLFFSYILGHSINSAFERIWFWVSSNNSDNAISLYRNQNIPDRIFDSISHSYADLVMIRHLFISTLFLGISLFIWLRKNVLSRLKWHFLSASILIDIIFLFAYLVEREFLNKLNSAP